jgi:putative DNA primase/helicase
MPGKSHTYADEFADKVVKAIEEGRAPWQKEWAPGPVIAPFNPSSGTIYKGANHVNLIMGGFVDPRYMTFKQAKAEGHRIKKGEKAQKVSFFSPTRIEDRLDDNGNVVTGPDGKPEKVEVDRPCFKIASVFNASQIENMPVLEPRQPDWDPVTLAETILKNSGAEIVHSQRDRAFYRPSDDRIQVAPRSQFATAEGYYATVLHELAHWTKGPGRVERQTGPKGSPEYAVEELRAEIASWMINTEIGLGHDPKNHVNYAANWAQAIKDDPKVIFRAARDAQKIKEFVMEFAHEKHMDQGLAAETAGQELQNGQAARQANDSDKESTPRLAVEKTWLDVPFKEKGAAKQNGAKWDSQARCWYAPEGTDLNNVRRWIPEREIKPAPAVSPEREFAEALENAGLDLGGQLPVMDGQLHRAPVREGKRGNQDGAYIGHLDGMHPAGYIQNHRTGLKETWSYTNHSLSQAEKAAHKEKLEEQRKQREQERRERHEKAAKRAAEIIAAATPLGTHPYLQTKGLENHAKAGVYQSRYGQLIVPAYDAEGRLKTLQFIDPDGTKKFLPGGEKSGSYHLIPPDDRKLYPVIDLVILSEGYATGATIHEALVGKYPVAVCFDANNLKEVAKAIRERCPDMQIVICADNDAGKEVNTGLEKAKDAARAVGGIVIAPKFNGQHGQKLSDFNDLYNASGVMTCRRQLMAGLSQLKSSGVEPEM